MLSDIVQNKHIFLSTIQVYFDQTKVILDFGTSLSHGFSVEPYGTWSINTEGKGKKVNQLKNMNSIWMGIQKDRHL